MLFEYFITPFILKPLSDHIKKSNLPYKEYYDDPEELRLIIEFVLTIKDVVSYAKNAYAAAMKFKALTEASGKAIGGHARWFWHYFKKALEDFTEIATDKILMIIENEIYSKTEHSLSDEEVKAINKNITVTGIRPGQTIKLLMSLPVNVPINAQYWMYYINDMYVLPFFSNDGDHLISLVLTDGGVGDYDGIVNGVIIHIGGLGIPQPEPPSVKYITVTITNTKTEPIQPAEEEIDLLAILFIVFTISVIFAASTIVLVIKRREV